MGKRHQAREKAFQLIFMRLVSQEDPHILLEHYLGVEDSELDDRAFCEKLFLGVEENTSQLEDWVSKLAINWELNRIHYADRAILMLALYEMNFIDDVPDVVSINEAIELAKKYSSAESSKFINGILDQAKKKINSC